MLYKIFITSIFMGFLFFSCEKTASKYADCTEEDYENCVIDEPFYGAVNVRITINDENPEVKLVFFDGNYESQDTVWVDTISSRSSTYYFDLNNTYSAAAYYKSGDNTIIAVDGGWLDLYTYTMCEYTCYGIIELDLDLRLK